MNRRRVAQTTWFHYHNYGTALQAVALKKAVESIGYDVDVVKYTPHGTRYSQEKSTDWSGLERVVDDARGQRFEQFIAKNLSFTRSCMNDGDFEKLNNEYDAFIAGSDQVWSPIVFDSRYYLDYVSDHRKKIGYAPSMGVASIKNEDIKQSMSALISQFAHLSAREEAGQSIIKEMTGRQAELVLDPTFLLDYSDWRKVIAKPTSKNKKKYVLCYFLGDNENVWAHARKIADESGLTIKILPVFVKDEGYGEFKKGAGPEEFFNLIDGAEVVLTDSFHGVIFSMLCSKRFYAFERFRADDPISQNSRVYNILNFTNLNDQLITYNEPLRKSYQKQIDFERAHEIIQNKRNESLNYLRQSLRLTMPLVSMIVPVYNVEKYIQKCLDSITAQTYRNIEVIVIDDGTPDNSDEIADSYSKNDKRIKVFHYKNAGLSVARNRGFEVSTGEYIVFVDSDDALAPDYVEYMLGLIENTNTNMAMSLARYDIFEQEQTTNDRFQAVSPDEVLKNIEYSVWPQEVWNKIYRKAFLDKYHIRHIPEILYGEGNTFNHYVLQHSGDIGVGYRRVYYYRYNPESSTRKFVWGKRMMSLEVALGHRQSIVNTKDKDIKIAFEYHKWNAAMHILKGLLTIDGDKIYPDDYKRWRHILRRAVVGTLRADQNFVSDNIKRRALKSYFFPKKTIMPFIEGFEWETIQADAYEQINENEHNIMPWDKKKTKPATAVNFEIPNSVTIEGLQKENARLAAELASFMSIKRSLRLFLGNIKRRIKYGKNRQ